VLKLTPTPALESGSFEIQGLGISENPSVALASVAARLGQEKAFALAAEKLFGTALPGPEEVGPGSDYTVFWTGPDQYFVEAPIETHEDIEVRLKLALKESASVTDQSGGWVRFDVTGEKALATFERLSMPERTVIEHIGCFIITREDSLSVWAPRSYAGSLSHALQVAAKSV